MQIQLLYWSIPLNTLQYSHSNSLYQMYQRSSPRYQDRYQIFASHPRRLGCLEETIEDRFPKSFSTSIAMKMPMVRTKLLLMLGATILIAIVNMLIFVKLSFTGLLFPKPHTSGSPRCFWRRCSLGIACGICYSRRRLGPLLGKLRPSLRMTSRKSLSRKRPRLRRLPRWSRVLSWLSVVVGPSVSFLPGYTPCLTGTDR